MQSSRSLLIMRIGVRSELITKDIKQLANNGPVTLLINRIDVRSELIPKDIKQLAKKPSSQDGGSLQGGISLPGGADRPRPGVAPGQWTRC